MESKESRPGAVGLENFKLKELQDKVDALGREIERGVSLEDFFAQEKILKDFAAKRFPDKVELYGLIYRSRFKRLWEQFRNLKIEFKEE